MKDVIPQTEMVTMLEGYLAAEAATPFVILFSNDVNPDHTTPLAALTEPTEAWYARIAAVYGDTYTDVDGMVHGTVASVQFNWTAAGGAGPKTIFGYGIVSAAVAGRLLHSKRFSGAGITLDNVLSALIVQPDLALPRVAA